MHAGSALFQIMELFPIYGQGHVVQRLHRAGIFYFLFHFWFLDLLDVRLGCEGTVCMSSRFDKFKFLFYASFFLSLDI